MTMTMESGGGLVCPGASLSVTKDPLLPPAHLHIRLPTDQVWDIMMTG